jgi:hypothetical protein
MKRATTRWLPRVFASACALREYSGEAIDVFWIKTLSEMDRKACGTTGESDESDRSGELIRSITYQSATRSVQHRSILPKVVTHLEDHRFDESERHGRRRR